jgi:glycosyltransferase involved in cell wall biosynthesis
MISSKKKILFITRKYPPIKGGMEQYSYNLYHSLINSGYCVDIIANKKGNRYLPFFIFKILGILLFYNRRYSHIHFGDALLSPLALLYKWWSSSKWSVTVHGLDITYSNSLYQKIIPYSLRYFDSIVAVSSHTKQECEKRGINIPIEVIPNGIQDIPADTVHKSHNTIKQLFSIGRLIPRKGIAEFVDTVGPKLPSNYQYIIAGDGVERSRIQTIIDKHQLQNTIQLVGKITDKEKYDYLSKADVFIMPNVSIPGDMEGFGITLIEASSYGVPAVARNIEGIKDAVKDGETGYLVNSSNADDYLQAIEKALVLDREQVNQTTQQYYHWDNIVTQYNNKIFI